MTLATIPMNSEQIVLQVKQLEFSWSPAEAPILKIPQLTLYRGDSLYLHGPSGSGKTTFLSLIGGLLPPQSGTISLLDHPLSSLPAKERDHLRGDHIGFIFQTFNLIPYLSALENVTLPALFSSYRRSRVLQQSPSLRQEALRILAALGLSDPLLLSRPSHTLSVGQAQRVAAARALFGSPAILVADEPTSALDNKSKQEFMNLLRAETNKHQISLIFVSHDDSLKEFFTKMISFQELSHANS